ncbi:MmcQ/YjbR family DNA-binding protein [Saccharopolyspora mangrovi]|uniref:MmcQ/YjbR family DNA-binding protein n=1 Tax=Saccharopolyspora mangrovi TaxID=3082379 RepID=A0ABU6AJN7_9PSEU|nr:hypothetical protein [Saccharopolyspora sp. S2-29]MEB3371718.1 hypothetical protein [Saccharopolyspora sp. S2-29]
MTTTGEQLQDTAREAARALPAVTHGRPFTEQLDVYKMAGKVFLIITDDLDELIITVKAEPEYGRLPNGRHRSSGSWPAVELEWSSSSPIAQSPVLRATAGAPPRQERRCTLAPH